MTPIEDDRVSLVAAAMMTRLLDIKDEKGEYLTERLTVADLWRISAIAVPVVRENLLEEIGRLKGGVPPGLSADEALVWGSEAVRDHIKGMKKIQAIKEARSISGMGLKEAKETVEKMEATYKASGGVAWVL
jgi:hypothetical protein